MTTELAVDQPKTPVAKSTIKTLLSGEAFRQQVANALPKHLTPDRFIRVALTAITRTPALSNCTQASLFQCLLDLSAMGLEPDGRRAHLIPYRNNRDGVTTCTLIVDYKGVVELALRSGVIANIHADSVCSNDEFIYDRGEIKTHRIDWRKPRGQAYAYYCLVRFKDGTEKAEVMSLEEIDAIRKRSKAGSSGPWVSDYSEMAKKTVFKRCSKWITLSPEIRETLEKDEEEFIPMGGLSNLSPAIQAPRFEVENELLNDEDDIPMGEPSRSVPLPEPKKVKAAAPKADAIEDNDIPWK